MKKAMRKRELDRVAIQSAMFDNFNGKKGMRFLINIYFRIYIKSFYRVRGSERKYRVI